MQINEHVKIHEFSGILKVLIHAAQNGTKQDIDFIMTHLNSESSLPMTRYVDFAVSLVIRKEGINQLEFYLFNGTLIQRNYCTLFFNRRGDWQLVKSALEQGLIDEIQAFSR